VNPNRHSELLSYCNSNLNWFNIVQILTHTSLCRLKSVSELLQLLITSYSFHLTSTLFILKVLPQLLPGCATFPLIWRSPVLLHFIQWFCFQWPSATILTLFFSSVMIISCYSAVNLFNVCIVKALPLSMLHFSFNFKGFESSFILEGWVRTSHSSLISKIILSFSSERN
jgi:hypothetical protein